MFIVTIGDFLTAVASPALLITVPFQYSIMFRSFREEVLASIFYFFSTISYSSVLTEILFFIWNFLLIYPILLAYRTIKGLLYLWVNFLWPFLTWLFVFTIKVPIWIVVQYVKFTQYLWYWLLYFPVEVVVKIWFWFNEKYLDLIEWNASIFESFFPSVYGGFKLIYEWTYVKPVTFLTNAFFFLIKWTLIMPPYGFYLAILWTFNLIWEATLWTLNIIRVVY